MIAGDAAWHSLQIDEVRQKASYPGLLVDEDRDEAFRTLHRLHLARRAVAIIPTHDHRAAQRLPASVHLGDDVSTAGSTDRRTNNPNPRTAS